jgi:molybdenum cofactor synthesis domain-containing protein
MSSYRTAVVVLSDRAAGGVRADACIPAVVETLGTGYEIVRTRVMPDDPAALQAELIELCDRERVALVLTSGGTGLASRDRTPQATAAVLDYEVPGIGEAMRAASAATVKTAMLSRAVAGVRGSTLVINLPGSPKAVRETLAVVLPALPHALDLLAGGGLHGVENPQRG